MININEIDNYFKKTRKFIELTELYYLSYYSYKMK